MEQVGFKNDTIAAISTPHGVGGIAVIRVSGPKAIEIVNEAWGGAPLPEVKSHTVHLGKYYSYDGGLLDEAVASVFKAPSSFTGENVVELGVHGSSWIQKEILQDLVRRGVRIANPGEFTQRAFLNGKLDLAQAEGVADLIASSSKAAHDMAINQTRGAFSKEFEILRDKLIEFASLIELELDFSEEDVEFANRADLIKLLENVLSKVDRLASSFSRGAAMKNGVPVVIAGVPNAGKSSLLNLLLDDDKAIVTDIPGTTRDIIEDTADYDGILFRFIDTAGLRHTSDIVEGIGVDRAYAAMQKAFILIWIIDITRDFESQIKEFQNFMHKNPDKNIIILLNKSDLKQNVSIKPVDLLGADTLITPKNETLTYNDNKKFLSEIKTIPFSTFTRQGLEDLIQQLVLITKAGQNPETDIIVTNARHYDALTKASESLKRVKEALMPQNSETDDTNSDSLISNTDKYNTYYISADFIAQDIREAISHLSAITGSITSDTILHSIFSRFCIGK